jgi:hypothetical protein
MARSRPTVVDNHGDARRLTVAAGAFIWELVIADKRVEAYYRAWYDAHEDEIRRLKTMSLSRDDAVRAAARFHATTLEATRRFVCADLQLPEAWSQGVAKHLTDLFRRRSYNHRHPGANLEWGFPVHYGVQRPGKWPTRNGQDIERNVRWFYRVHVQQPPDYIHDLARDYHSWTEQRLGAMSPNTDSRETVQGGIKQARALLELAFCGPQRK